jgi:hypothetical protein
VTKSPCAILRLMEGGTSSRQSARGGPAHTGHCEMTQVTTRQRAFLVRVGAVRLGVPPNKPSLVQAAMERCSSVRQIVHVTGSAEMPPQESAITSTSIGLRRREQNGPISRRAENVAGEVTHLGRQAICPTCGISLRA